jgi:ribosomal protein S18 acetylase RimI-like enzyme
MTSSAALRIRAELRPGDAGEMIRLQGVHYAAEHGLDRSFEAHVAAGLAEALARGWPEAGEGVWLAEQGGRVAGALALVRESATTGRVRWFIVDPALRGRGVGRRLLEELLELARTARYERLVLETFGALEAAAHLYRDAGFRCVRERHVERWGRTILLQDYELTMPEVSSE